MQGEAMSAIRSERRREISRLYDRWLMFRYCQNENSPNLQSVISLTVIAAHMCLFYTIL